MNGTVRSMQVSALAICAFWSGAAIAQTEPTGSVDTTETRTGIDEIVVTARRTSESEQDVPLSITAFSPKTLETLGVKQVEDLQRSAPSLTIRPVGGRREVSAFELRGLGATEVVISQDPAVGVYLNDVALTRPHGLNQSLYDVESIQVLYGPQGTLFGRNTVGGAVLINTSKPTDRLTAEVIGEYGNYDFRTLTGIINLPVSEMVQLRLAGKVARRDGFTENVLTNERLDANHSDSFRVSLALGGNSRFNNLTVFDYFRSNTSGASTKLETVVPCNPGPGGNPLAGTPPVSCLYSPEAVALLNMFGAPNGGNVFAALAEEQALGPRRVALDAQLGSFGKNYGLANTTTFELTEDLLLKNIFGYRRLDSIELTDIDGSRLPILATAPQELSGYKAYSNELQLQGTTFNDALSYIVGAYYFRESGVDRSVSTALLPFNPTVNVVDAEAINTSKSLFAQATLQMPWVDGLSVTAGYRHTWDTRVVPQFNRLETLDGQLITCNLFADDAKTQPLNPCARRLETKFDAPSYNLSLEYELSPDVLAYIAHRRGYRSGGFNRQAGSPTETMSFRPETVKDIEAGLKADYQLGDVFMRTNLAVYKTFYDDVQRIVVLINNGVPATTVVNAASATIQGFELSQTIQPVSGLELSGRLGYVDAVQNEFSSFDPATNTPVTLTDVPFGVSKWTGGLAASYDFYTSFADVTIGANFSFKSKWFSDTSQPFIEPQSKVPAYQLLNANISFDNISDTGLSANFWVNNLTNEDYQVGVLSVIRQLGFTTKVYGEPRMYGLKLSYKFGD